MKIYIVSLARDIQKRLVISDKLKSLGLKFEFVDAVYGKELPQEMLQSLNVKGKIVKRGYMPTPGELGCTLSHKKIMEMMLENGDDWCCILEDDAELNEKFENFIKQIEKDKLNKENIYILGGQNGLVTEQFIAKSFFSYDYIGKQKFNKVIKSERYVNRTCCYLISDNSAKKYIDYINNFFFLADDWSLLKKNGVFSNIYLSNFVDHPLDLSLSSIEQERVENNLKVEKSFKQSNFFKLLRYFYFLLKRFNKNLIRFMG